MTSSTSMAKQSPSTIYFIIPLLLLLSIFTAVDGAKKSHGVYQNSSNNNNSTVKLFVFGDSYVDTGNFVHSGSYKPPSGITYPGQPAGRFSDGRVLTDYIASYLKIQNPVPYAFRNSSNIQYGMNFAYGGTGVFNTLVDGPNMTAQIDSFEKLIEQNVYTKTELESSVALVNAGSNDYTKHFSNWTLGDIPEFTEALVKQICINLRRIHSLGVGKVAVGLLEPFGCWPALNVITFHQQCIDFFNQISENHGQKLQDAVKEMNLEMGKTVFIKLDLYNSFLATIKTMKKARVENSTLLNPLKQCCVAEIGHSCGSVDDKGEKKYSVCDHPELSFFWDIVHPSQNGWSSIYKWLEPSLGQLTQKNF